MSDPQVDLYNIQGLRYPEDNDFVKLGDQGMACEIITTLR